MGAARDRREHGPDWSLDKAHPAANSSEIGYLFAHVNKVLVTPLTCEDVEGVCAGLRPLRAGESETTSALWREHVVGGTRPGAGGRGRGQVHDLSRDGR